MGRASIASRNEPSWAHRTLSPGTSIPRPPRGVADFSEAPVPCQGRFRTPSRRSGPPRDIRLTIQRRPLGLTILYRRDAGRSMRIPRIIPPRTFHSIGKRGDRWRDRRAEDAEEQKGRRTEGQKNRRAEVQKNRRAEGQKSRRTEDQENKGVERQVLGDFGRDSLIRRKARSGVPRVRRTRGTRKSVGVAEESPFLDSSASSVVNPSHPPKSVTFRPFGSPALLLFCSFVLLIFCSSALLLSGSSRPQESPKAGALKTARRRTPCWRDRSRGR